MSRRPTLRRALVCVTGAAMMAVLTACSSGSGSSKDNPLGLQDAGVLHVGTLTDAPPNVYLKDGQFTGFDNDLLKAVAAKEGLKTEFAGTDFSALLSQVKAGKYDVGSSSITITDKRRQTVDFTSGYDFGYLGLEVPAGSSLRSFDQLSGHRVVVVQGTVQDDYASGKGLNPVRVPDYNSAMNQLKAGTADAWVSPAEIGDKLAGQSGGKVAAVAKELSPTPMAFAVAKDKPKLKEALDKGLDEVVKDGTWSRLVAQYYPGRKTPAGFTPGSGAVKVGH